MVFASGFSQLNGGPVTIGAWHPYGERKSNQNHYPTIHRTVPSSSPQPYMTSLADPYLSNFNWNCHFFASPDSAMPPTSIVQNRVSSRSICYIQGLPSAAAPAVSPLLDLPLEQRCTQRRRTPVSRYAVHVFVYRVLHDVHRRRLTLLDRRLKISPQVFNLMFMRFVFKNEPTRANTSILGPRVARC